MTVTWAHDAIVSRVVPDSAADRAGLRVGDRIVAWNGDRDGDNPRGFVSGGLRFLGDRRSAHFAIMVPIVESTIPLSFVSFAWRF
jgi:hypothetical protein